MKKQYNNYIQKVIKILEIGGRSKNTISNYVHAIHRFLKHFKNKDISNLNEDDIIQYMKTNYLNKSCSANTYNMNLCAIKYFYEINFNKFFNTMLLPYSYNYVNKSIFIFIF